MYSVIIYVGSFSPCCERLMTENEPICPVLERLERPYSTSAPKCTPAVATAIPLRRDDNPKIALSFL